MQPRVAFGHVRETVLDDRRSSDGTVDSSGCTYGCDAGCWTTCAAQRPVFVTDGDDLVENDDRAIEDPWPHDEMVHAWWVEPGVVLAGEYPGAKEPRDAAARVNLLVDHGIGTFVDLTSPADGLTPYDTHVADAATLRGLDLRRIAHPIPDMGVVDADAYDAIIDTIADARNRGGVYLHCWGGIGRTSTVVGCLLVAGGLDADAALADIDRRRSFTRKAHQPAPETQQQIGIIRTRASQHARPD